MKYFATLNGEALKAKCELVLMTLSLIGSDMPNLKVVDTENLAAIILSRTRTKTCSF